MQRLSTIVSTAMALLLGAAGASAGSVTYEFTGGNLGATLSGVTGLTASDISYVQGTDKSNGNVADGVVIESGSTKALGNFYAISSGDLSPNPGGANLTVDGSQSCFRFRLTPAPGKALDFSAATWGCKVILISGATNTSYSVVRWLMYSLDGGATWVNPNTQGYNTTTDWAIVQGHAATQIDGTLNDVSTGTKIVGYGLADNALAGAYTASGRDFGGLGQLAPDQSIEIAVFVFDNLDGVNNWWSGADDIKIDGLSVVDVPPNPYVAWAQKNSLTNSMLAAMGYDVEPDGMNNLVEYALGGNPNVNDAATVMPHWVIDGPWLDYIYNRRTNYAALGLDYNVETRSDFSSNSGWTNANYTELVGPVSGEFETVTNRMDTRAANSRFIRLQIGYNGLYPGVPRGDIYRVKIITSQGSEEIPVFQDACPEFVLGKQGMLASDETALNLHAGQTISWASFDLSEPVTVQVEVMDTNRVHLGDVRIFPSRSQISPVVDGNTISFTLENPGQFSVEIGTEGYQNGLMIFADPPELDAPSPSDSTYAVFDSATPEDLNNLPAGVDGIYFAKGTHDIGIYNVPSSIKNIYIERGAWVYGALDLANHQDTRVFGRGVLSGRKLDYRSAHGIEATASTRLTVEGIVVDNFKYFALRLISTYTTVSWVKTIGAWTWNSDGISVRDNSQVDHCFIWANDDAIKPYRPNITFSDIEVWQLDNGGTIQMSWGNADSDNVVITNLDVLHAEWNHPAFNNGLLCCVGNHNQSTGVSSSISNWRIEDVVTETPVPNIFQITPDPSAPLTIQNLTMRNWTVDMPMNTAFVNQIVGNDPSQPFSGFVFDNFVFNGTKLTQQNWETELQMTPVNLDTPVVQ